MKKWVKVGSETSQGGTPDSTSAPIPAYSRYESDSGKQEQLTEQLRAMTKAHNSVSASNKTIRNGFYGTKD